MFKLNYIYFPLKLFIKSMFQNLEPQNGANPRSENEYKKD